MKTTKTKAVTKFNPDDIALVITGAVKTNTLPKQRKALEAWLDSLDANTLTTDADFTDAAKFVIDCKTVETRLENIRKSALEGNVFKALNEIEQVQSTIRQKRLEFDRVVNTRRNDIKREAVEGFEATCRIHTNGLRYRDAGLDILGRLRLVIKGKSSILKMVAALEAETKAIFADTEEYSGTFGSLTAEVTNIYTQAGETITASEVEMMVNTHFKLSPDHARLIVSQRKVVRDQKVVDAQKQHAEAPAQAPAEKPPAPAPGPAPTAKTELRFGATFFTADPAQVISLIESVGGQRVTYVNPKERK